MRAEELRKDLSIAKARSATELLGRKPLKAREAVKMELLFETEKRVFEAIACFPRSQWRSVMQDAFTPAKDEEIEDDEDVELLSTTPLRLLRAMDKMIEAEGNEEKRKVMVGMREDALSFLDEGMKELFERKECAD